VVKDIISALSRMSWLLGILIRALVRELAIKIEYANHLGDTVRLVTSGRSSTFIEVFRDRLQWTHWCRMKSRPSVSKN
jgi:hypothetical protein